MASETIQAGSNPATQVFREHDARGRLISINPPGGSNTLRYVRNDDGLVTSVRRGATNFADLDHRGARPVERAFHGAGGHACHV